MIKIKHIHVRGSSMGLVLTISILVTLLASFFVLRSNLNTTVYLRYETHDRLLNNAQSGIELLLDDNFLQGENSHLYTDLFDSGRDCVYLEKKHWGVFDVVISKAFWGNKTVAKKALLGAHVTDASHTPSLVVCDFGKPLAVCGNTKLNGKCYVPAAGFKRAYIEGQHFNGERYVNGVQLASSQNLPAFNPDLLKGLTLQLKKQVLETDSVIFADNVRLPDTLVHSFNEKTIVLRSNGKLVLNDIFIKGNVKIVAPLVLLRNSCQTDGILVLAGSIEVDDGFEGSVQFLANETIRIGKKVVLKYPSIVGCIPKQGINQDVEKVNIYLDESCTVYGDVFCVPEDAKNQTEAFVQIQKQTVLTGNVYVQGRLSVQAKINGSLYCKRMYLKTNSGTYENHLLNVEVDAALLPKYFAGCNMVAGITQKEIMQWL